VAPQDLDLTLELVADASLIGTARMFAGAAARHAGCDEATTEDVKIAISEGCTRALRGSTDPTTRIRVAALPTATGLTMSISGPPDAPRATESIAVGLEEGPDGLAIIETLFPGADERTDDGRRTISFTATL
jgi:anti-sigma regulatory factor (Ser/Thr protein kinase)